MSLLQSHHVNTKTLNATQPICCNIYKLQWQSYHVKGSLKISATLKYEEEFLATYLDPRRIYHYLGSEKIHDVNLPIQLEGIKSTHSCWKSW